MTISVVDPNPLNLDPRPDPEFWPNLDPDPGLFHQFREKKIIKNKFREEQLSLTTIF